MAHIRDCINQCGCQVDCNRAFNGAQCYIDKKSNILDCCAKKTGDRIGCEAQIGYTNPYAYTDVAEKHCSGSTKSHTLFINQKCICDNYDKIMAGCIPACQAGFLERDRCPSWCDSLTRAVSGAHCHNVEGFDFVHSNRGAGVL